MIIFFVNPWRGIIGPNVGMGQLVRAALARGHKVHLATPWRDEFVEQLIGQGAVCHLVPEMEAMPRTRCPLALVRHGFRARRVARRVGQLARDAGADVIAINSENMLCMPAAGKAAGCPVAVFVRGLRFGELGTAGKVYFAVQKRRVDRYVAVSEAGAELLKSMGVPPGKIAVIPNGVDTGRYTPRPRPEALAAELGIAPDELVLGAVTHLTPRKGAHHLVEALGRVSREAPAFKCIILGQTLTPQDEPYAESIRRRIAELGLAGRVILPGYRTDVPDLLNLFDVMVHPSQTENCPRSVIEAQSSGTPVVGFRVGGMPEVVSDGVGGILIDPFDTDAMAEAVLRLLREPSERQRLGAGGRENVLRRFDLSVSLDRTLELLTGLAGVQRRGDGSTTDEAAPREDLRA